MAQKNMNMANLLIQVKCNKKRGSAFIAYNIFIYKI